jgi:hypothetical protein
MRLRASIVNKKILRTGVRVSVSTSTIPVIGAAELDPRGLYIHLCTVRHNTH